jgi:hypothetical protein
MIAKKMGMTMGGTSQAAMVLILRMSNKKLFFGDDVCAAWNVEGGRKKHSLTDLKLIKRHDSPSPNHNIIYEVPG